MMGRRDGEQRGPGIPSHGHWGAGTGSLRACPMTASARLPGEVFWARLAPFFAQHRGKVRVDSTPGAPSLLETDPHTLCRWHFPNPCGHPSAYNVSFLFFPHIQG